MPKQRTTFRQSKTKLQTQNLQCWKWMKMKVLISMEFGHVWNLKRNHLLYICYCTFFCCVLHFLHSRVSVPNCLQRRGGANVGGFVFIVLAPKPQKHDPALKRSHDALIQSLLVIPSTTGIAASTSGNGSLGGVLRKINVLTNIAGANDRCKPLSQRCLRSRKLHFLGTTTWLMSHLHVEVASSLALSI